MTAAGRNNTRAPAHVQRRTTSHRSPVSGRLSLMTSNHLPLTGLPFSVSDSQQPVTIVQSLVTTHSFGG